MSEWDAYFWATEEEEKLYDELFKLIFPTMKVIDRKHKSSAADVGDVLGHIREKRDIFVTRDRTILRRANELLSRFGIAVMTSADAVKQCQRK